MGFGGLRIGDRVRAALYHTAGNEVLKLESGESFR